MTKEIIPLVTHSDVKCLRKQPSNDTYTMMCYEFTAYIRPSHIEYRLPAKTYSLGEAVKFAKKLSVDKPTLDRKKGKVVGYFVKLYTNRFKEIEAIHKSKVFPRGDGTDVVDSVPDYGTSTGFEHSISSPMANSVDDYISEIAKRAAREEVQKILYELGNSIKR